MGHYVLNFSVHILISFDPVYAHAREIPMVISS